MVGFARRAAHGSGDGRSIGTRCALTPVAQDDLRRLELSGPAREALQGTCAGLVWPPRPGSAGGGVVPGTGCAWRRLEGTDLREAVVVYREATHADRRAVGDGAQVVVVRILTNRHLAALSSEKAVVQMIDAMDGVSVPVVRRLWQSVLVHRRR